MSIVVKKLYNNGTFLYKMKLISGKDGLNNLVQWVHIIEDDEVSSFLNGNELVFTAGILNHHKDWLINFAKKLYESGASALVVNIGPHTKEIPKELMEFCDQVSMPLFTIPWETRMVDMTRDFCQRIMNNDHVENTVATTIKNVIFKTGDFESQILQLERYGYQRNSRFCFICMSMDNPYSVNVEDYKDRLRFLAERIAKGIREQFISFSYKASLVFVIMDYEDEETEEFVETFAKLAKKEKSEWNLYVGVSSNQQGIYNQDKNFEKAFCAMEMSKKRNEDYNFYDKLGIYKLLYSVEDKTVLRDFYNNTIQKLEDYDRKSDTTLVQLLETYLENNGSLQIVSEKMFIHRNTVNNQLKKIEQISGFNPLELEDKIMLNLGFYIKNII